MCRCRPPVDFPTGSRGLRPRLAVSPMGQRKPPGYSLLPEPSRGSSPRALAPRLCSLAWPSLGSVYTVAPPALRSQGEAEPPWVHCRVAVDSGVCFLPWFSFLSHFAGVNLREPSVCKRRSTPLPAPSQACAEVGRAGKRCFLLCPRLLPQFLDPTAPSPGHSSRRKPLLSELSVSWAQPWASIWSRRGWREIATRVCN